MFDKTLKILIETREFFCKTLSLPVNLSLNAFFSRNKDVGQFIVFNQSRILFNLYLMSTSPSLKKYYKNAIF